MGPTLHQEQQTRLRKGPTGKFVITAIAEGFSIVCCVCYRLDCPIDSKQAHPFPEGAWCLGSGFGASTLDKEFLQDLTSQLSASVTQSRSGWDLLGHIVADGAQTA